MLQKQKPSNKKKCNSIWAIYSKVQTKLAFYIIFLFFKGTLIYIIILRGIYLTWEDIGQYIFPTSRLYSIDPQKTDY